jgi:acetyltransferase-like isoleucine patch superfamily enzyme
MPHLKEFLPQWLKDYYRLLGAKLRNPESFIGSPHIGTRARLGKGCSVSRGAEIGNDVWIGDYSYLNCGAIVASGTIGRFCSIGPYALIGLADHPIDHLSTSPFLYGGCNLFRRPASWDDFPSPPKIGSDVWIGAHAFVRQGVRIGSGAIIGAGAVVTRDVPAFGIAAGVPCRLLRYRFQPQVIQRLLKEPWWDLDVEELSQLRPQFFAAMEAMEVCPAEEALR